MFKFLKKKKKITNIEKLKTMNSEEYARFIVDNIYSFFRYDVTKSKFKEDMKKWLESDVLINYDSNVDIGVMEKVHTKGV